MKKVLRTLFFISFLIGIRGTTTLADPYLDREHQIMDNVERLLRCVENPYSDPSNCKTSEEPLNNGDYNSPSPELPQETTAVEQVVLRTLRVLELEVVEGRNSNSAAENLLGATWHFLEDGNFVFNPGGNLRKDIYPMGGSFKYENNVLIFQAHSQSRNQVAFNEATIYGQMDLNSDTPILNIDWTHRAHNAAVFTTFTSHYKSKLLVGKLN